PPSQRQVMKDMAKKGSVVKLKFSKYLGGLSAHPIPIGGTTFAFNVFAAGPNGLGMMAASGPRRQLGIPWEPVASVEVSERETAKSKVGATVMCGVVGALGSQSRKVQTIIAVHARAGQTAYFVTGDLMEPLEVRARLSTVMRAAGVP